MSARAALRRERPMRMALPGWRPADASARRPPMSAPPVLPPVRSAPDPGSAEVRALPGGERPAPLFASKRREAGLGALASVALHGAILAAGIALTSLVPQDPLARGGVEAIPVEFILVGEEDRQASMAAAPAAEIAVPMPEIAERPDFPLEPVPEAADFAVPASDVPTLRAADFAQAPAPEADMPPAAPRPQPEQTKPLQPTQPEPPRPPQPAKPQPVRPQPQPPRTKPAARPAKPAPVQAAQPSPATTASVRGGSGGTQGTAGNADVVNSYARQVLAHLARQKRYPAALRDRGVTGTVRVSFTIDGSGAVRSVALAGSSGAAPLDEEALAMARRASPFPPIPPEAGRTTMAFTGSVRFDLRDF